MIAASRRVTKLSEDLAGPKGEIRPLGARPVQARKGGEYGSPSATRGAQETFNQPASLSQPRPPRSRFTT